MPYLVPAIVNSMAILTYLKDPEHSGAGLSEIAGAVSIPTSTCLNLLRTLVHFGLLSFDANTKQYRLGWALFELGSRAADHLSHVEVLRPHLSALAKNLGVTCVLGREVGPRLMIIDKVEGSDDLRATTSVGQYHPMTSGAVGRAILAYWKDADLLSHLEEHGLPRFTETSITDLDALRRMLGDVRRLGYAVSLEEYYGGINAVASPVFEPRKPPQMVVASLGLASVLTADRIPEVARHVRQTAIKMTAALGGEWLGGGDQPHGSATRPDQPREYRPPRLRDPQ